MAVAQERRAQGAATMPSVNVLGEPVIDWLYDVIHQYEANARREPGVALHRRVMDAVRGHPQSLAQSEASTASSEAILEARSGYLPTISGSSDGGYRRVGPTFEGTRPISRTGIGAGLQARQMIYDFGATSNLVDAASQRRDAGDARREAVEIDLAMRALVAHHDVMRARLLLGLAERNVLDRSRIVALLESRREVGGGADPDIRRATARLASARSALVTFQNRLRSAESAYLEAFGVTPERLRLAETPAVPASLEAALGAATDRHPALREAKSNLGAARSEAEAVRARGMPNVGLEAGVSRREQLADGVPGTDASLLLVFRYNFYTGGADTARLNQALARGRQADFDERSVARQLDRAVRQAYAEVENAAPSVDNRIMAVMASADALRASREQFEINRGSLPELLKAQEDLFDAGRELIEAVFDGAIARYRLLQLSGSLPDILGTGAVVTARPRR